MSDNEFRLNQRVRVIVVVSIMLVFTAIHWYRIGTYLKGDLYIYYYSYASDLMLPFCTYFLLGINEIQWRFFRKWYIKIVIVISVMTFSEIMQLFGVYFFGVTFDLIDILMYGIGAFFAAFFDKQIFERCVPFWKYSHINREDFAHK